MSFGTGQREGRSLGSLVSSITEDLSILIRGEIALAKAEMSASAKAAAKGALVFAIAGALSIFAFLFLLFAAAYGLVQAGLDVWAGFLIVALILLAICAILLAVGVVWFKKVKGPERAKQQREATKRVLSTVPQRFKDATERAAADAGMTPPRATTPPPAAGHTNSTSPADVDDLF